jgi:hypothetical protein
MSVIVTMSGTTTQAARGDTMKKTTPFLASLALVGTTIMTGTVSASAATQQTCAAPTTGYGRLFPGLSGASYSNNALSALATATIAAPETDPTPEGTLDPEENTDITAGYTYFGQFVDHDLTADDRPNDLTTPTPVASLVNLRTPQLDLDSLYGSGPAGSPQLYDADGLHLLVGQALMGSGNSGAVDLPRAANGQALIADGRNDENRIVAGIHSMFLRLHNLTVDAVKSANSTWTNPQVFAEARRQVTAQYQSLVINDFLPQIVGQRTVDTVLARRGDRTTARLRWYTNCAQMPVEFSVAAYRYGHSQVRGLYRINSAVDRLPVFGGSFGTPGVDLVGFSPSPSNFAIDWAQFFTGGKRAYGTIAQLSYKIDASLTHSLSLLPLPVSSAGPADLAKRNLLRSVQLSLPSGQDVARAMGLRPLPDDRILVGKASGDAADAVSITTVSPEFANKAPLWTYVLAESVANAYRVRNGRIVSQQIRPYRLGPVGGRIVAETIVGLLASDPSSILNTPARVGSRDRIKAMFDRIEDGNVRPVPSRPRHVRSQSRF